MLATTGSTIKLSKILLYIIPVLPFVLWANISFPYVTIRTSVFRIIVEIVVLLLLYLLITKRAQIQGFKNNFFVWIFGGLVSMEIISALFGESLLFSLFGDLERMWGIITVLHLFIFYVLLRILFGEREWKIFFHTSFVTSILVSVYGIVQHFPDVFGIRLFEAGASRIPSTLGNPAYVSIYLLFNIAFALYYLLRAKGNIKYFYIITALIAFYAFTLTDIRGAYIGFIVGLGFAMLAYIFLGTKKNLKYVSAAIIGVVIIAVAATFAFPKNNTVRSIGPLKRLSTIELADESIQTRFIAWNIVWEGFKESPILGVGMENFDILFNEYFPARYYNLAKTETYFDRAHNQFLNILSESGIFAFLFYLGFIVFIGFYLVRGLTRGRFTVFEFMIFSGISIAYFVHLFFVFEDINSYIMFAAFLGLIEYKYFDKKLMQFDDHEISQTKSQTPLVVATIIIVPLVLYAMFGVNIKTLRVAKTTAQAYVAEPTPSQAVALYQESLGKNLTASEVVAVNFADYLLRLADSREQIMNNPRELSAVLDAFNASKRELLEEIEKRPNSSFLYMKLGHLEVGHNLFDDDIAHLSDAIQHLNISRELSPERLQILYLLGEAYVLADQPEAAISTMEEAIALNAEFGASYYFLGRAYLAQGDAEKAYDLMINKALLEVEFVHGPQDPTLLLSLSEAFVEKGDYERVIAIYKHIINIPNLPSVSALYAALAAAYVQVDELDLAVEAAQKAAELDPDFAREAEYFIQLIEEGRIDELKETTG